MKNLFLLIILFLAFQISADVTIPAGNVNGVWTESDSPYFIDGEITLQMNDQLIIQPGVEVRFNDHYKFIIHGKLLSEGTLADSILFTVADTTGFNNQFTTDGSWHGLRFQATNYNGQGISKLEYCRIEYAKSEFDWNAPYADKNGGGIYVNLSSNLEITKCEISNNMACYGGGIFIWASSPIITELTIQNNFALSDGGGIMITGNNANPELDDMQISQNVCFNNGGGIFCSGDAAPSLNNVIINENSALGGYNEAGGGISSWGANLTLSNVTITSNSARYGGGIEANNSDISITNSMISNNLAEWKGGGINNSSVMILSGVTISENVSEQSGGGILFDYNSETIFDPINRCNIYFNSSINTDIGNDLCIYGNQNVNVIVDTFTVLYPDNHDAYPIDNFTFDIQNYKIEQIFADLYISPTGSDENSGLTQEDPLQTITYAMSIISANSYQPQTIYLANGTYSPFTNGETFPIDCKSYVTISGEDRDLTILNAQGSSRVLNCLMPNASIENLTVANGHENYGGGIYIEATDCYLGNLKIQNNTADNYGGGIYCGGYGNALTIENVMIVSNFAEDRGGGIYHSDSNVTYTNCEIIENVSNYRGGGVYSVNSTSTFTNTFIANNSAAYRGGGIYTSSSNTTFEKSTIIYNSAGADGGGIYANGTNLDCENVTISNNYAEEGSGLYSRNTITILTSSIMWNNSSEEIYLQDDSIEISFCDIMDGEAGIAIWNNGIVNWLDGNIETDPLFADSLSGNFQLTENSPCIDIGNPYHQPDPDGSRTDMGAYYFHHTGGGEQVWANFVAEPVDTHMNSPVNFNDTSLAFNTMITSWEWDFENDGIIDSYESNPVFCYPDTGYYSVSLSIADDLGNSNTMIKTDYITIHAPEFITNLWNINPEGSDDLGNGSLEYPFATIQQGISISVESDTILVQPGTYFENINYLGKNIVVGSLFYTTQDSSYISQTTIDGSNNGTVVELEYSLDNNAVLCGFTITHGSESGICCNNSSPEIRNNIITENTGTNGGGLSIINSSNPNLIDLEISFNSASENGGGIYLNSLDCSLQNIQIYENFAEGNGGGIYCEGTDPYYVDVFVSSNSADGNGGGVYYHSSNPLVERIIISSNTTINDGGGIYFYNSEQALIRTVVADNIAGEKGGGIFAYNSNVNFLNATITDNSASFGGGIYSNSSNAFLTSSIFWNNTPQEIEFEETSFANTCTINYSDFSGGEAGIIVNNNGIVNWQDGIIDENPLFLNSGIGDFHLTENSLCIDAGDPFQPRDPDSTRVDMGSFYFHHIGGNEEVWANFVAVDDSVNLGEYLLFEDQSISYFTEITNWNWDFENDGIVDSYLQNPSYCFQDTGHFSVSLTVEDDLGNFNTIVKENLITVYAPTFISDLWHVTPEGCDELGNGSLQFPFATIQKGINVSTFYDTVLVHPGIYQENVKCIDKIVTIGSCYFTTQDTSYIAQTVIDGDANGTVIIFENISDSTTTLCGFTITNGSEGGIICDNASPNICNNVITQNSTDTFGAGIMICNSSQPIIENVLISNNYSDGRGGGIGISAYSNPRFHNITVANNEAETFGGGLMCFLYSNPIFVNSIFWNNYPEEIYSYSDTMLIVYSDVQNGWEGEGNIDSEPLFDDPENGNYHLTTYSPCIDTGTAFFEWDGEVIIDLAENEFLGSAPEMGAYEGEFLSSNSGNPIVPLVFNLAQNYPNPFNPETKIQFSIPLDSKVDLVIYNLKGQKVKQLVCDQLEAGIHSIIWNSRDENEKVSSSGIYFYKVKAKVNGKTCFSKTMKMMLLK
jgi:predicted outer membrane repeat protein